VSFSFFQSSYTLVIADAWDRVIRGLCDCVCDRILKGKRLELSTPNLIYILYSRTSARRSKGQRSRSLGYENRHGGMVASVKHRFTGISSWSVYLQIQTAAACKLSERKARVSVLVQKDRNARWPRLGTAN